MGVRIFVGHEAGRRDIEEQAILFDSVTETAFGPIFNGGYDEAEEFLEYLKDHPVDTGKTSDARRYSSVYLADLYWDFVKSKSAEHDTASESSGVNRTQEG